MAEVSLNNKIKLLVIGGSAGSLEVILRLFTNLKKQLAFPVVIVVHRKSYGDSLLSELLSAKTNLYVKEAEEKEKIIPGGIYVSPPDYHLLIEKDETFSLDDSEKINYSRPSIDVTFESAADVYGAGLACMLLSGANADGVEGLKTAKEKGAYLLVQDPSTAEVAYMPMQAIKHVHINKVFASEEVAGLIDGIQI